MSGDDVLGVIDSEIAELEAQIRPLQEKRDWLKALKRKAGATNGSRPKPAETKPRLVPPHAAHDVAKPSAPDERNVNDMIIDYVREQTPAPVQRREIVEFLLSRKTSKSGNPRQMMFGYISGLVTKGFLERASPDNRDEVVLGSERWNPKGREG
jgi:hypothetical protein